MKICFNVTSKCSNNCLHCFRNKNEHDSRVEQNCEILNKLKTAGIDHISWSGGEFFMYEDYLSLLKKTKELDMFCSVTSNATFLTDEVLDKCLPYIDRFVFSLDFPTNELSYQNGRGNNLIDRLNHITNYCRKKKPNIILRINTVAMKSNTKYFDEISNIVSKMPADVWKILQFSGIRIKDKSLIENLALSQSKFDALVEKMVANHKSQKIVADSTDDLENQLMITPSGNLTYTTNHKEVVLLQNIASKSSFTIEKTMKAFSSTNITDLDLNLYKTFYNVAKMGGITTASKKMYVSQPAISKSIKKLEQTIGEKLLDRKPNGVELTEKGARLFKYLENIFNLFEIMGMNMSLGDANLNGKLSIGSPSHIASFFLFKKIKEFHQLNPFVEVSITSRSTAELVQLLDKHEIDFIVDVMPFNCDVSAYSVKKLGEARFCLFVKKDNEEFNNIQDIQELKELPLILPVETSSPRKFLNNMLTSLNCELKNVFSIETSEMIVNAVKQDLGIGYVIYDFIKDDINNNILKEICINSELPKTEINLVYNKNFLSNTAKNFIHTYLTKEI